MTDYDLLQHKLEVERRFRDNSELFWHFVKTGKTKPPIEPRFMDMISFASMNACRGLHDSA